jgi:hypothetical protein
MPKLLEFLPELVVDRKRIRRKQKILLREKARAWESSANGCEIVQSSFKF